MPEFSVRPGYRIAPQTRVFAAYNLIYWSDLVRPGGVIDTEINPNLLPPPLPGGAARPLPLADSTDFLAHGLTLGVAIRF